MVRFVFKVMRSSIILEFRTKKTELYKSWKLARFVFLKNLLNNQMIANMYNTKIRNF